MVTAARWRPLQPGEPIGVVALSGPIRQSEETLLAAGLAGLETWGHPLLLPPNLDANTGYLAGNDSERLHGLERLLDQGARVLLASRGGYGVTRLLDHLPWSRLVEEQVCLIGYSDLTALLNPLVARGGVVQVHGPMVAAGLGHDGNRRRLQRLLNGRQSRQLFRFPPSAVVRPGRVSGVAVGGNLSMLCALLGTGFEPSFQGTVLFLEEVNEPLYRIDRLLTQLASSGRLNDVKAIIGGSLKGCRPVHERNHGWRRLLAQVSPAGSAVVVGLPFGHGARNHAFPVGASVTVDTATGQITWSC
jgi:muramoyltetrapeptide carboxypeptidase